MNHILTFICTLPFFKKLTDFYTCGTFRALHVILGKEQNSEYLSFQKEEYNGLQMGLAKSSTYRLLLLKTANKYCSSLPSVYREQYVCISVQRGTLQS